MTARDSPSLSLDGNELSKLEDKMPESGEQQMSKQELTCRVRHLFSRGKEYFS